jgi:hypothetical protein
MLSTVLFRSRSGCYPPALASVELRFENCRTAFGVVTHIVKKIKNKGVLIPSLLMAVNKSGFVPFSSCEENGWNRDVTTIRVDLFQS